MVIGQDSWAGLAWLGTQQLYSIHSRIRASIARAGCAGAWQAGDWARDRQIAVLLSTAHGGALGRISRKNPGATLIATYQPNPGHLLPFAIRSTPSPQATSPLPLTN